MALLKFLALAASCSSVIHAINPRAVLKTETRSIDEIYQAALKEGGIVTLWHGGDEKTQQNTLKTAFEARFPGMTLNVTVDVSKYHDGKLDLQLAANNVYVDSIILQTLHDYPRWKKQGALLPYKPAGFDQVYNEFKDPDGTYSGLFIIAWSSAWSVEHLGSIAPPREYTDFLKPEFKDKLALTYPNDDDAILYQFEVIIKQYGWAWFDALLKQNPRWVRGTATGSTLVRNSNGTYIATFTSSARPSTTGPLNATYPTQGKFVSWPQTGAILKNAPHPEGAKLLHNFILSEENQKTRGGWSVRRDIPAFPGFPPILTVPSTNPVGFIKWMQDRAAVERFRFLIEDRIGTAQGLSPLIDDL